MINFLNLEYFVVAAEELNFTKAAKRLFISQQSLSNHIANMEREFGVSLFNRTTPLTLTYAGQRLLVRARRLLTYKDETYHELADIKDFTVGQLSIGLSHTRGRVILPHVLPAYRKRFPNIDLNILEGNTAQLEAALLHGDVDLVIGLLPFRVENIETVPICADEVLLAVSAATLENFFGEQAGEILSTLREHADLTLLQDCPFILLKKGNRVRAIADELFQDAEISPHILLELENIETALALSAEGMGITFYPEMFAANRETLSGAKDGGRLNLFSMRNPITHGTLAIGYHKGHYMSQATKEFIAIVKEMI